MIRVGGLIDPRFRGILVAPRLGAFLGAVLPNDKSAWGAILLRGVVVLFGGRVLHHRRLLGLAPARSARLPLSER